MRKAYYNRLRFSALLGQKNPSIEEWQIEDYSLLSTEQIFHRLQQRGLWLNESQFVEKSASFDTAEEMADSLPLSSDVSSDELYLLIFELWKRLFHERSTLSQICDELDQLIFAYENNDVVQTDALYDRLIELQSILALHVDAGISHSDALKMIQSYLASSFVEFLYEFILDCIERGLFSDAEELIEGYLPYLNDDLWFIYLQARTEIHRDPSSGFKHLESIIVQISRQEEPDLAIEMLHFLSASGNPTLFHTLFIQTLGQLKIEEDFIELILIAATYLKELGLHEEEQKLNKLLQERISIAPNQPMNKQDPDLERVATLLQLAIYSRKG